MKKRIFITSTGTGIGKTYVAARILAQARTAGKSVEAHKPIISGFDMAAVSESDTGILLRASGLPVTPENAARASPWRYAAPLAPSMAARLEGRPIDFDRLAEHSRSLADAAAEVVVIEGVGGVMVPVTDRHTVLDWMERAACDIWLVVGSYLGSISHTLTAIETMRARKLKLSAVIVNESEGSSVSFNETCRELERWVRECPLHENRRSSCGLPADWL